MPPSKRKSGGGGGAGSGKTPKKSLSSSAVDSSKLLACPHAAQLTDWYWKTVIPSGSPDLFLSKKYPSKDAQMEFAAWINDYCPAAGSCSSQCQRQQPWMMAWRSDAGVSGMIDPEIGHMLMELYVPHEPGFARRGKDIMHKGAERVCLDYLGFVAAVQRYSVLALPPDGLLPPFSVGYIKGWRRSLMLLVTLAGIRELEIKPETIGHEILVACLHQGHPLEPFMDLSEHFEICDPKYWPQEAYPWCRFFGGQEVPGKWNSTSRTAHFACPENAAQFSLREDWGSASAIAKAFSIGKSESAAVAQLVQHMHADVRAALTSAVRQRGMPKLVLHETLAKETFAEGWSSGTGQLESWRDILCNVPGIPQIALLLVQRMSFDYDNTPPTMRKAMCNQCVMLQIQKATGFLHWLHLLEKEAPSKDYDTMATQLKQQFMYGYMDGDIMHVLETEVPPGQLAAVSAFRPFASQIQKAQQSEKDEAAARLAENVRAATFTQLSAAIAADMKTLQNRAPTKEVEVAEQARDLKYVRERQLKGQEFVENWMAKHCCIIELPESLDCSGGTVFPTYLKHMEQFRGVAGKVQLDNFSAEDIITIMF
ncbi:unnamed protein product [Symbiodinium sp. KB8]|nr:unnamed protein product [Symbiodinium sp. KB8]